MHVTPLVVVVPGNIVFLSWPPLLSLMSFPFYSKSMERNHSVEKFDQIKWTSEDQISGSGQAKSYACTFCKRGFSNAQALGGHMNIHRRDRARIRQYLEDQNQLSPDEVKNSSLAAHHDPARANNSEDKTQSQLEMKGTNMIPRKSSYPFSTRSEDHEIVVCTGNKGKIGSSEDAQEQLASASFVSRGTSISKWQFSRVYKWLWRSWGVGLGAPVRTWATRDKFEHQRILLIEFAVIYTSRLGLFTSRGARLSFFTHLFYLYYWTYGTINWARSHIIFFWFVVVYKSCCYRV